MVAARVVKRVSSTWWNTLIIDKGMLDGLATDTPVISASGLIGKTGKMAPHMAEVILLTDEMCRVSAKIDGTLEQGIISGERAGLDLRPDLHLRFLRREAAINPGSLVHSTGEGGVFPSGLLIGRVKRFEIKDITGEAIVEPAVDLSQLRHVFVLEVQNPEETPIKN
jgi:rod shape-determining protein MreC